MAHDLLFTEPLVENSKIKGPHRSSEAITGSRFLPAAGCALAAAWRAVAAARLQRSCGRPAKCPAWGHDSNRLEAGLIYLAARSTLADDFHTLTS